MQNWLADTARISISSIVDFVSFSVMNLCSLRGIWQTKEGLSLVGIAKFTKLKKLEPDKIVLTQEVLIVPVLIEITVFAHISHINDKCGRTFFLGLYTEHTVVLYASISSTNLYVNNCSLLQRKERIVCGNNSQGVALWGFEENRDVTLTSPLRLSILSGPVDYLIIWRNIRHLIINHNMFSFEQGGINTNDPWIKINCPLLISLPFIVNLTVSILSSIQVFSKHSDYNRINWNACPHLHKKPLNNLLIIYTFIC